MKTIAIIPARGGSKRLPNKNIQLLDGIPLLAHSILFAKKNKNVIDAVFVSTNDENIKQIALEYGANVVDRPERLAGDFEPTVSSLKQVLQTIDLDVENVILLQPTNPLRPDNLLQDAFEVFQSKKYSSLFTVTQNHHKLGRIQNQNFVPFNYEIGQRSQDLEPLFYENGLLYITKAKAILNDEIITKEAFPFIVNHIFATVDIDTQEDFDYVTYLYHKFKNA